MTKKELNRIRYCCPLLPPPGEEVVKQLLDEIDRLREEMQRREDYIEGCLVSFAPVGACLWYGHE